MPLFRLRKNALNASSRRHHTLDALIPAFLYQSMCLYRRAARGGTSGYLRASMKAARASAVSAPLRTRTNSRENSKAVPGPLLTPPSSLLRAHAPDQVPPVAFGSPVPQVFAGCRQSLLASGPSRHYLCNPCTGAWTPTPRCSLLALVRFFQRDDGLTSFDTGSAHQIFPIMQLQLGATISRLQSFRYVQAPVLASPPGCTHRRGLSFPRAARTFTPRNNHVVTHHELWYRYVSDTDN